MGESPHICLADARAKASEAKVMINADGDLDWPRHSGQKMSTEVGSV
ncbi:hypothetical protein [Lonsdalea quercina]